MPSSSVATTIDVDEQIRNWHSAHGELMMPTTDDALDGAREIREMLERWGLNIWPSPAYVESGLDLEALKKVNLSLAHNLAWGEQVEDWLDANTEPVIDPKTVNAINETAQAAMHTPKAIRDDAGAIIAHELFTRVLWEKHQVFSAQSLYLRPKRGVAIPEYVWRYYGMPAPGTSGESSAYHGAVRQPPIPNAFADGSALVVSNQAMMGALKAIYRHPTAETATGEDGSWTTWPSGVPYCPVPSRKGATGATIYMQYDDGREMTKADADQLWSMARDLDEWTANTLLSCIAQAVDHIEKGRQSPDGLVWIDINTILGNTGRAKKTKGGYTAGYKPDDQMHAAESMARIEHLWVRLNGVDYIEQQQNGREVKKPLPKAYNEGRLLAVMKRTRQETFDGPGMPIAWGFTLGDPLKAFVSGRNRMVARLSKKALHYHETGERWERRLAIYCMFYMRVDAKTGHTFRRRVGTILDEIEMLPEVDRRNPERTRQRLHKALGKLVADGIIGAWDYATEDNLPPRNWLDKWMDRVLIMHETPGSLAAVEHQSITDKAQRRRDSAQRTSMGASAKRPRSQA